MEASFLHKDVVIRILSQTPSLGLRHVAQARLVCRLWRDASEELMTSVRLSKIPDHPSSSRLFSRLSNLPCLETLWLGPAAVRQLLASPSSSEATSAEGAFRMLVASSSLKSIRFQPDAQNVFVLPQVILGVFALTW